jgi:nucleotide-binding universal stress UspA family protein
MLTLLVPVDGSKNSLRAVKYAAAQSKHCPVTLHIVNVEPRSTITGWCAPTSRGRSTTRP